MLREAGRGVTFAPVLSKAVPAGGEVTQTGSGLQLAAPLSKGYPCGHGGARVAKRTLVAQVRRRRDPRPAERALDPASICDVTSQLAADGNLSHDFSTGSGSQWAIVSDPTASGQAQWCATRASSLVFRRVVLPPRVRTPRPLGVRMLAAGGRR